MADKMAMHRKAYDEILGFARSKMADEMKARHAAPPDAPAEAPPEGVTGPEGPTEGEPETVELKPWDGVKSTPGFSPGEIETAELKPWDGNTSGDGPGQSPAGPVAEDVSVGSVEDLSPEQIDDLIEMLTATKAKLGAGSGKAAGG